MGRVILTSAGLLVSLELVAKPAQGQPPEQAQQRKVAYQRIGGLYRIETIEKEKDNSFRIIFESVQKTKNHNKLLLTTDHVHLELEQGFQVRLSAEILAQKGDVTEVSQVLLFMPKTDLGTHIPIWLLSNHAPQSELRGARYLEMHSPASDYTIF